MAEEKKDSKSKVIIIVLIIVIVLLLGGGTAVFLITNNSVQDAQNEQTEITKAENQNPLLIDYDNSAVAIDENGFEKAIDELKNKSGDVTLEFKNQAFSADGKEFSCYLANAFENTEDMFIVIYKDSTLSEQVYLSGLLKPGSVIEHFTSEIQLDRNSKYSAIILFSTVADDHETMTSQTPVEIDLIVE